MFIPAIALVASADNGIAQKPIDTEDILFTDFSISGSISAGNQLTSDQIKIIADKKSRDIEYFSRIDPASFNLADPNSWLVINQIRGGQSLIFLLDLNSLDNIAVEQAKTTIRTLLSTMPDDNSQRFMLASLGNQLRFLQSFTPDKNEVISSLDDIAAAPKKLDYKSLIESLANIFTVQYRGDKDQAIEESIREANIFLVEIRNRAEAAVEGLGMFADWFETLSGPKHVLLFSGGYPIQPGPVVQDILRTYNDSATTGTAPAQRSIKMGGGSENISPGDTAASIGMTDQSNVNQNIMASSLLSAKMGSDRESVSSEKLKDLIGRLNKNQIVLYAYDSRDVRADGLATSSVNGMPSQLVGRHNSSHITTGREFLEFISEPTRGMLISDQSRINSSITGSERITYLVGIKTDKKKKAEDSKSELKIEIKGNAGGAAEDLDLKFRTTPFQIHHPSSDEALAGIFNFPGYYHDFSPAYAYKINKDEITGQVAVSPRELGFVKENNNFLCMLEVLGLLTDSDGNPVTGKKKYTFAKQFPLRMNAGQYKDLLTRETVSASASAKGIQPGDYLLTMVVRQPRTGLLSASKMNVTVE